MDSTTVHPRRTHDASPSRAVPAEPAHPPAGDLDLLVRRAADGDAQAWNEITDRFTRLVWAVARSYRLNDMDAADVVQNTWLRLVENLTRIERPQALPKWLSTTAGREALTIIRKRQRELLTRADDDDSWEIEDDQVPAVDADLLGAERDSRLRGCFEQLPERDQMLLRLLMTSDSPRYVDVSSALDMPVGSIGPTRMRALARLRQLLDASDYPFG